MSSEEIQRPQEILEEHRRRLHVLEMRSARSGYNAPPEVTTEMQHIRDLIREQEKKIAKIKERDQLEQNLSSILREQNITTEQLALNVGSIDIRNEIRQAIESALTEMRIFERTVSEDSDDAIKKPQWYLEMANGFTLTGDWLSAAKYYDKYAEFDPDNWEIHYLRAVAYQNSRAGRHTNLAALRAQCEAIALIPEDLDINFRARLYGYRGATLKRLNRLEEAENDLLLARKWAMEEYEINDITYNLACVYAMSRRKDDMLQCIQQLLKKPLGKDIIIASRKYFHNYWNDSDFRKLLKLI